MSPYYSPGGGRVFLEFAETTRARTARKIASYEGPGSGELRAEQAAQQRQGRSLTREQALDTIRIAGGYVSSISIKGNRPVI
ncbi:MAG: hypothetical protein KKF56_01650 [Nanoarchaeota archaeon]|nr:hypothetical protein [Nanoarchaeota archaeon]